MGIVCELQFLTPVHCPHAPEFVDPLRFFGSFVIVIRGRRQVLGLVVGELR